MLALLRPPLSLTVSRAVALPARWAARRIPRARTPPERTQPGAIAAAAAACRQCRESSSSSSSLANNSTAPDDGGFWDGFENVYDDKRAAAKPTGSAPLIKPRRTSTPDFSGADSAGLLRHDHSRGSSDAAKPRRRGRWRHQIITQPNLKYKPSTPFIPFFDYREWGWLRHQAPREDLPPLRKMHRRWKAHCQAVLRGQWQLKFDPRASRQLVTCTSGDEMLAIWEAVTQEDLVRQRRDLLAVWRPIVLSVAAAAPEKAPLFVEATTRGAWQPPGYMIADVIRMRLDQIDKMESECDKIAASDALIDTAIVLLGRGASDIPFRQNDLFRLQRYPHNEKTLSFYMALLERGVKVHPYTMAQFAYRFATQAAYKPYAMRIIYEALTSIPGAQTLSCWSKVCTVLFLPAKFKDAAVDAAAAEDTGSTAQDLWAALIPAGFTPNLIHFTALIRYLCVHGHMDIAWKVFDVVVEHDIDPDPVLYAILLDGAKRQLDAESFQRTMALISDSNTASVATWNSAMHCILGFAMSEAYVRAPSYPRVVPVFVPLLDIYRKVFDMRPLTKLLPPGFADLPTDGLHEWSFANNLLGTVHRAISPDAEHAKLQPSPATLTLMMIAYLRNVTKPFSIMELYTRFRQLLLEGDDTARSIVEDQGTLVYDMVIKAFATWPGMLRVAVDVFNDMMAETATGAAAVSAGPSDAAGPSGSVEPADSDAPSNSTADPTDSPTLALSRPAHPAPSVYTWNILLHAWMVQQAGNPDHVVNLMKQNGITPVLVTWNTLISGYARQQNANNVLDALGNLHSGGFTPDAWTMRGLERLRNRDVVLRKLQSMINSEIAKMEDKDGEEEDGKEEDGEVADGGERKESSGETKNAAAETPVPANEESVRPELV